MPQVLGRLGARLGLNKAPRVHLKASLRAGLTLFRKPISGEASCKNCHGAPVDVPDALHPGAANKALIDAGLPVMSSVDDPMLGTEVPLGASVEYATDINVLRLHDVKHGTAYRIASGAATSCTGLSAGNPNGNANCLSNKALVQGKPVVCQVCHYTPALDLAQVGPLGGVGGTADADANGRVQRIQKSNSRVLHTAHAAHTDIFPPMPAPTADSADTGLPGNQPQREAVLEQTCYQCHPGTNTKCMRGAMANGGMLCQDCHGEMDKVGNDFSVNMSVAQPFPNCIDTNGNADGIRPIRAYLSTDVNAKPIVPSNKRFAENTVPATFNGFDNPGAGNQKLYRVSTGHGGVMCEGCHGATHAEWDTDASPLVNDNVTGNQLQGHSGTVSECSTCHVASGIPSNTQSGPHGMHVVNDSRFWSQSHKDMAKAQNGQPGGGTCGACHGSDHLGTVLSRAPVTRTFSVEGTNRVVQAGEPVGCGLCHSVSKSFGR